MSFRGPTAQDDRRGFQGTPVSGCRNGLAEHKFLSALPRPPAGPHAVEKVVFFKNRLKLAIEECLPAPRRWGSKLWRRPPAYNANAGRSDYDTLGTGHRLRGLPAARTR